MKASVKTAGFIEMDNALGELAKATGKNVMLRAAVEALGPVADAMRAKAPRDDGDLQAAIAVGTKRAKGAKKHFRESTTVEAYAGVSLINGGMPPQGVQQEFGNQNHPPQPFARPSWEAQKMPTLDRTRDALANQIEAATARARRKAMKAGR